MFETFLSGNQINWYIAYLAGVVTFFASCLLPLVPTYLAYLSGVSLQTSRSVDRRWYIFRISLFFVAGFVAAFVVLGLMANQLGSPLAVWKPWIEKLAGVVFMFLGLFVLGAFDDSFFMTERKPAWKRFFERLLGVNRVSQVQLWLEQHAEVHAFLVGIGFAFGWSPCIGPVLAVILYWASQTATATQGALLLFIYGLGLGTPFLLTGLLFEKMIPILKQSRKATGIVMKVAGTVIFVSGLLLLLGEFQSVSMNLLNIFNLHGLAA